MVQLPDDGFMIAWSTRREQMVEVGPWPDYQRWSREYESTSGCCYSFFKNLSRAEQAQAMLNLAAELMFQGVPPENVLKEFAKVGLWRDMSVLLPLGRMDRAFIPGCVEWQPHNPE